MAHCPAIYLHATNATTRRAATLIICLLEQRLRIFKTPFKKDGGFTQVVFAENAQANHDLQKAK